MKKIFKLILLLLVSGFAAAWFAGGQNWYLGSANYCKTAFEVLDTEWISYDLEAQTKVSECDVIGEESFCMPLNVKEKNYLMRARGHKLLDIFSYTDNLEKDNFVQPKTFRVKYKKRLGKVVGFTIYDIDKNDLLSDGEDDVTFFLIDNDG